MSELDTEAASEYKSAGCLVGEVSIPARPVGRAGNACVSLLSSGHLIASPATDEYPVNYLRWHKGTARSPSESKSENFLRVSFQTRNAMTATSAMPPATERPIMVGGLMLESFGVAVLVEDVEVVV